jgi:hypothetical protein
MANAAGRKVLVPRAVWPDYTCDENGGTGWTALIIHAGADAATVAFVSATTPRGLPYANEDLQLSALRPL